jgi:import receptor subunit TOM70
LITLWRSKKRGEEGNVAIIIINYILKEKPTPTSRTRKPPPPINVLPLVNKGLTLYQWKQDVSPAEQCCRDALELDPECEAAVATLGQLSLQAGRLEDAVRMFGRQAELARSEAEMNNALTYHFVSGWLCESGGSVVCS